MMKTLTLLAVALAAPLWAAEEAPKLPPAIQAIVEKAEADVSKNRKVYDAANSKSLDAAEKALKAELEKMTKAGKLEEAMAAKKTLESVRADVVARVDERAKDNGGLLDDSSNPPGTIKTSLSKQPEILKENAKVNNNRNAVFTEIPKPLSGHKYIVLDARVSIPYTITIITGGTIYLAIDPRMEASGIESQGFKRCPFVLSTNHDFKDMPVFSKNTNNNETISIPGYGVVSPIVIAQEIKE